MPDVSARLMILTTAVLSATAGLLCLLLEYFYEGRQHLVGLVGERGRGDLHGDGNAGDQTPGVTVSVGSTCS
ncbi:MAG: hypothetical protein AMXMBFR58_37550 [Phycisphaerae bacterium]